MSCKWYLISVATLLLVVAACLPALTQSPPVEKKPPAEKPTGGEQKPAPDAPAAGGQEKAPAPPAKGAPAPPTQVRDPQAVAVIDRYIEAIGGREAHAAIQDKELRWVNKKFQPTGVTEVKMVRYMKGPYMIREEWDMPGMGLLPNDGRLQTIQVYDGKDGFVKMMGYVSKMEGRTLHVFVFDKYLDDAFLHWDEDGYSVKYLGEETVDEIPAVAITTNPYAGNQLIKYCFAKDTGLLLQKEYRTEAQAPGGVVTRRAVLSEYAPIKFTANNKPYSVKFATTERVFEEGDLSVEREYSDIRINGGVSDAVFLRPDGPDFSEHERSKGKPGEKPTSQPATQPKAAPPKHDGAAGHGGAKEPTTKPGGK